MKPTFVSLRFLAVLCVFDVFVTAARSQDAPAHGEIQVLFIGNSLTYVNDLPRMVAELARAGKQRPVRYERETPGGCTLEKHWKDGKALAKIQSRKWDFVVLQDHSQAGLKRHDAMLDYGRNFDAEISKAGAKTLLYLTWANQNKPDDQTVIDKAYLDLSKELHAKVAPVGIAWAAALTADKGLVLHQPDRLHPNPTGTYLAACVFYGTIYGKSPEGLPGSAGKLTDDAARPLQAIAWQAVQRVDKGPVPAREKPVVGLIPKAQKPIAMDGKLTGWEGAFVTPVHVGHPDFDNRGGEFLYLWDEQNLYIGLRCLDKHPTHVGTDQQIWNGDAVEFYLDTRRGSSLGGAAFGAGTLHMFYTPFTRTDVKPRWQIRDLPVFKNLKLQGVEVAGARTPWGYTAEFKLPWANFPAFTPKEGEIIGIECELCSSDGGPRVDRTFVYSSPAAVGSPSAFGRVQLVKRIEPGALNSLGRALLPLSLTSSANYPWLYGTVCVSPTIAGSVARLEGKLKDATGKVRKTSTFHKKNMAGGFALWMGSWELFDLPAGIYALDLTATDKTGALITARSEHFLHGSP